MIWKLRVGEHSRKYADEGADVYMCHVANGNMGHVEIQPGPLREIRTEKKRRNQERFWEHKKYLILMWEM